MYPTSGPVASVDHLPALVQWQAKHSSDARADLSLSTTQRGDDSLISEMNAKQDQGRCRTATVGILQLSVNVLRGSVATGSKKRGFQNCTLVGKPWSSMESSEVDMVDVLFEQNSSFLMFRSNRLWATRFATFFDVNRGKGFQAFLEPSFKVFLRLNLSAPGDPSTNDTFTLATHKQLFW